MRVKDDTVTAAGQLLFNGVVHQMGGQLAGGTAAFGQTPDYPVVLAGLVHLDDTDVGGGIQNNVAHEFAGTGDEETLHDALWRSDGTIDQLYLALRLAVAEELTPDSPLILDDALVRFDDTRMQAALAILEDMAKARQVILFTCQQREGNAANV